MATRDKVVIEILTETRKAIGDIRSLVGGITTAVAAVKSLQSAFDAAQDAAAFNQQQQAFRNLAESAGVSAQAILDDMERLSGGTVTTFDTMRSASRAALLGIPLEDMAELMEIARASALATGESVQFMFESITTGIGRASPLILDNLGITVKIADANERYAATLNKTAAELTEAEKKQALLNAVLESGASIIESTGAKTDELTDVEKWALMTRAVKEFTTEAGQAFNELFAGPVGQLAEGLLGFVAGRRQQRAISEFRQAFEQEFKAMVDFGNQELLGFQAAFQARITHIKGLIADFGELDQSGGVPDVIRNWTKELEELEPLLEAIEQQITVNKAAGGVPAALTGDDSNGALPSVVRDVGVLAASLGEVEEILLGIRMAATIGDADIGLGGALGLTDPELVPRMKQIASSAEELRQSVREMFAEGAASATADSFVSAMQELGRSLAEGASGAEALGGAFRQMISEFASQVSMMLLQAGLQLIIDPRTDPALKWVGVGLIAASGLVALGVGLFGGSAGDSGGSGGSGTGARASASGLLTAPVQQAGTIVVNNVTVQGSVITERQLAASVSRAMQ